MTDQNKANDTTADAAQETAPETTQGNTPASFDDLGLSEKVLDAVKKAGFTEPTVIQREAIPHVLQRKDVLGLAQTGSGKTAAFVLPMLTLLEQGRARARMPRTLILEPTRELAAQVYDAFQQLGVNHRLKVALLIGGVSFDEQSRIIDRGADVLIATPGRLLDHFERGKLLLTGVEILVIDEADRMLDMGFIPDIERIVKLLPFTRQTLFFSATMPKEIQRLVDQFLHLPARVEAQPPSSTAETIEQSLVLAPQDEAAKRAKLREIIDARKDGISNAIVFANRKKTVAILLKSMLKHGYSAGALHGDMDQYERLETLQKFRDNEITYLIASDVAARGLDIPEVSHVFNHDIPVSPEDYVHRIGRTGRAGRKGTAVSLVTPEDFRAIAAIMELIGKEIPWEGEAPTPEEIEEAKKRKRGRGRSRGKSGAKGGGKDTGRSARGGKAKQEQPSRAEGEGGGRKKRRRRRRKPSAASEAATPQTTSNAASSAQGAEATARSDSEQGAEHKGAAEKAEKPASSRKRRGGKGRKGGDGNNGGGKGNGNGGNNPSGRGFDENNLPAFLARPVERD